MAISGVQMPGVRLCNAIRSRTNTHTKDNNHATAWFCAIWVPVVLSGHSKRTHLDSHCRLHDPRLRIERHSANENVKTEDTLLTTERHTHVGALAAL